MSCKGTTFMYGYKGTAKYQLRSLASLSSVALQTMQYDCKRGSSAMRAIGWNGAEISVRESEWKLMQNVDVEHNCEVGLELGMGMRLVYGLALVTLGLHSNIIIVTLISTVPYFHSPYLSLSLSLSF